MEAKLVYKIYEIVGDGTLKPPVEYDDDPQSFIYKECGYDSCEEALADINAKKRGLRLVILPSISIPLLGL